MVLDYIMFVFLFATENTALNNPIINPACCLVKSTGTILEGGEKKKRTHRHSHAQAQNFRALSVWSSGSSVFQPYHCKHMLI